MKTLLFLLLLFASCNNCADCTRTWTVTVYGNGQSGSVFYNEDSFEECGTINIKDAEDGIAKRTKYLGNNVWVDSSASCICIYQ